MKYGPLTFILLIHEISQFSTLSFPKSHMKQTPYKIQKLDHRFNYHEHFEYYINFHRTSTRGSDALTFIKAQKWFEKTYGWSAEIRAWYQILAHCELQHTLSGWRKRQTITDLTGLETNDILNPAWSWTNGKTGTEYRIYCASEKEVAFFTLSSPLDQ
jgi:hypothetical protein